MYESRAIARYLDEKYPDQGTQLYPKGIQERAKVDQATWAELFHFYRHGVRILYETLNKKSVKFGPHHSWLYSFTLIRFFAREANLDAVEEAKKEILAKMDIYENILSKQKYLAGDVGGPPCV
jgi:glutathione S-transferase